MQTLRYLFHSAALRQYVHEHRGALQQDIAQECRAAKEALDATAVAVPLRTVEWTQWLEQNQDHHRRSSAINPHFLSFSNHVIRLLADKD